VAGVSESGEIQVQRFFQRPVVEAVQWTGDNFDAIADWSAHRGRPRSLSHSNGFLELSVDDQGWTASVGCWVVYSRTCGWSVWAEHAFAQSHQPVEAGDRL
jgi:hypothetical protein